MHRPAAPLGAPNAPLSALAPGAALIPCGAAAPATNGCGAHARTPSTARGKRCAPPLHSLRSPRPLWSAWTRVSGTPSCRPCAVHGSGGHPCPRVCPSPRRDAIARDTAALVIDSFAVRLGVACAAWQSLSHQQSGAQESTLNPIAPCGACNEWLKKIAEVSPCRARVGACKCGVLIRLLMCVDSLSMSTHTRPHRWSRLCVWQVNPDFRVLSFVDSSCEQVYVKSIPLAE